MYRLVLLNPRQPKVQAAELKGEPTMVDPEAMEDRCLHIVNVNGVLNHVKTQVVGLPER